jgi:peroxiredoxin
MKLPKFSLPDTSDVFVDISSIPGKWALVIFAACAGCFKEIPFWDAINKAQLNKSITGSINGLYLGDKAALHYFMNDLGTGLSFNTLLDIDSNETQYYASEVLHVSMISMIYLISFRPETAVFDAR